LVWRAECFLGRISWVQTILVYKLSTLSIVKSGTFQLIETLGSVRWSYGFTKIDTGNFHVIFYFFALNGIC